MWMLYAQKHRTKSYDLKSAVERLYEELGALEFDADHEAIYGMARYYTVQQCEELRDKYKIGRKSRIFLVTFDSLCGVCLRYSPSVHGPPLYDFVLLTGRRPIPSNTITAVLVTQRLDVLLSRRVVPDFDTERGKEEQKDEDRVCGENMEHMLRECDKIREEKITKEEVLKRDGRAVEFMEDVCKTKKV
ncbi:hypothetical protein FQA39_LY04902 [Lamprigera yunnana]|nr:hypothetical protein FQA39_LY04902 [Lamprigera yunnana]